MVNPECLRQNLGTRCFYFRGVTATFFCVTSYTSYVPEGGLRISTLARSDTNGFRYRARPYIYVLSVLRWKK